MESKDLRPFVKYNRKSGEFDAWVVIMLLPKFIGGFKTVHLANDAVYDEIERIERERTRKEA